MPIDPERIQAEIDAWVTLLHASDRLKESRTTVEDFQEVNVCLDMLVEVRMAMVQLRDVDLSKVKGLRQVTKCAHCGTYNHSTLQHNQEIDKLNTGRASWDDNT